MAIAAGFFAVAFLVAVGGQLLLLLVVLLKEFLG
jgi:hypothetical protein